MWYPSAKACAVLVNTDGIKQTQIHVLQQGATFTDNLSTNLSHSLAFPVKCNVLYKILFCPRRGHTNQISHFSWGLYLIRYLIDFSVLFFSTPTSSQPYNQPLIAWVQSRTVLEKSSKPIPCVDIWSAWVDSWNLFSLESMNPNSSLGVKFAGWHFCS